MQITGLPSTTTVDANSVFALENSGITYKANGNAMANGLQTLMETNSDTGWVNITPLNGLEVAQRFAVRRVGKTVSIVGHQLHLSAANNVTGTTIIGNVGANFQTSIRFDFLPAVSTLSSGIYLSVRDDGNILLVTSAGLDVNYLFFSATYLAR